MITRLNDIPSERITDCEFIIITHRIGDYFMSGDDCFRFDGKQLKMIRCGNSNGYKLNGLFRSMTWIKYHRRLSIDIWLRHFELLPF